MDDLDSNNPEAIATGLRRLAAELRDSGVPVVHERPVWPKALYLTPEQLAEARRLAGIHVRSPKTVVATRSSVPAIEQSAPQEPCGLWDDLE
jgi:hypothetical protein